MCGRFVMKTEPGQLAEFFGLAAGLELPARYNIAPTQVVAAVLPEGGKRVFKLLRWGLIPSWAKDIEIGSRLINARAETVFEKPAFRAAVRRRRCLVPADGFYEWGVVGDRKQPFFICMREKNLFAIAAIWEHWESPDGSQIDSCALLTTEANALMRSFHHRMPVILERGDFERWLDPAVEKKEMLEDLLAPYPAERMTFYPLGRLVDNPRNDLPACMAPLDEQAG